MDGRWIDFGSGVSKRKEMQTIFSQILTEAIYPPIVQTMEITDFEWDEQVVAHLARHSVFPDEIEELAFDDEPWIRKGRGRTRYMLGYAISGRYLFVVYTLKGKGVAKVITAMDMDDKSRRLYKKRRT